MTLQEPSSGPGAQSEALVFLSFFADLPDPRQAGKVIYLLQEVLLLCLLAVLAGAENFVEIARFGEKKIELLRRFLPFKDGTPSHDQLGDIFATLDATIFQRCFRRATYCPRTAKRSSYHLPVPSALWRTGADQTAARTRRLRIRRLAPTRRLIRELAGMDD
jgi:hypothetical protein